MQGQSSFEDNMDDLEEYFEAYGSDTIPLNVFSAAFETYHGLDSAYVSDYYTYLFDNKEMIKDEENIEYLQAGIGYYVDNISSRKWIFRILAEITGAGCYTKIVAGLLDANVIGVTMVITAPVGILIAPHVAALTGALTAVVYDIHTCE